MSDVIKIRVVRFSSAQQTAQIAAQQAQVDALGVELDALENDINAAEGVIQAKSAEATAAASTATTKASEASASAAAALGSATTATNKASEATTAASTATTKAGEASASAAAALASKNAAQAAEAAMALLYDDFDDRYLGAKATPPALDNDGNAILVGALYFDTTLGEWRIWNGSAWQNAPFTIPGALLTTNNLADVVSKPSARQNLGLEIGADVQAFDADLASIAALATTPFGRSLLTLLDASALAAVTQTQLDARYIRPEQIPNPPLGWYGFRDVGDGSLVLETASPFDATTYPLSRWNMRYADEALALGLVIGLNTNSNVSASNIEFSYATSPDAASPTDMAWGFRDLDNGDLLFEVINPASGESIPSPNWNMGFVGGGTAWGQQGLFELFTVPDANIVLNY